MPDEQRVANNSQTYVADADSFELRLGTRERSGDCDQVQAGGPRYHAGDVLVVLSGSEIYFHGMIGQLSDGWAVASDHRGSCSPLRSSKIG